MLHVGFYGERVCPVLEVKKRNFRHPSVHANRADSSGAASPKVEWIMFGIK